jgi:hypothetical protein
VIEAFVAAEDENCKALELIEVEYELPTFWIRMARCGFAYMMS